MGKVRIRTCGPLRVDGVDAGRLRPKEQVVLAALALDHPRPVPTDRLAQLVWAGSPPATARKAIHNHLARLRRVVPDLVVTGPDGYQLASHVELDDGGLAAAARAVDTGTAVDADHLAAVTEVADGAYLADLPAGPDIDARRARHRRMLDLVREGHVRALLAEDRNEVAALAARDLVEAAPDSERRWWLVVLALARTGRRREALAALAAARRRLVGSGLDLGADLAALEQLVVAGDPILTSPTVLHHTGATGLDPHASGPIGVGALVDEIDGWLGATEADPALTLVGPAGSGKTTVAGAAVAVARRRGVGALTVGCDPEPAVPLQPLVEVLEVFAARHGDRFRSGELHTLGVLSPVLADAVGGAEAGTDHQDLLDAVAAAFAVVPDRPTLVVVEDLHWAPPLTVQALGAAARGAAEGGLVRLLFTTRPADEVAPDAPPPGPGVGTVLSIPPWTVADVDSWLTAHEPQPARREVAARWLRAQTGGRPLFVRELTLALLRDHRLGSAAQGAFAPPPQAPPAVVAALAARVDRLGPAAVHALEVAAVIGARVPRAVVAQVPGVAASGLAEVVRAGMLAPADADDGVLVFEHELLRRAVLDRLAPASAAEIHHLVLVALDDVGGVAPAVRAHHAVAAAALDASRAVRAADQAAEAAVAGLDHAEAGRWWLIAAEVLAERLPRAESDRLDRVVRAGEALMRVGDTRSEEILFTAATDAAAIDDWETAARAAVAVCRLGPTSMAGRPHQEATDLCDRLLARIESPRLRASLAAATTMVHSMAGAVDRCRELFGQAEVDAARDGSDEAWIDVLPFAYMSLSGPADLDRREVLTDRLEQASLRAGRADGRWSALHLRFSNQLQRGDPALRSTADELAALADQVRERQRDWECCYVQATVAYLDGRLDEAEATITETLAFTDTVAESRVVAVYGVQLLALRLVQHRLHELVDTVAGLADDQPTVGAWRAALALAAAQAGRGDLARTALDAALADDAALLAHDYAYTGALVALAEAAALLGDTERAAAVRPLLEPWAGRWSWVGTCTLGPIDGSLARLCALTGDHARAVELAARAQASARRLGAPVFARLAQASFPERATT